MKKFAWVALGAFFILVVIQTSVSAQLVLSQEELEVFHLLNNYRQQHGLAPVVVSPRLTLASKYHSRWMADNSCFAHQCSLEPGFGQRLLNANYRWRFSAAENIAAGRAVADRTFLQWVNSPSHNATLLDPRWQAVGVGRAYNSRSDYRWYWTLDFGDVVDTALPAASALTAGVRDALTAPAALGAEEAQVQVLDLAGQTVFQSDMLGIQALNGRWLNNWTLPNGTYLYVVTLRGAAGQWRSGVHKLVVLN